MKDKITTVSINCESCAAPLEKSKGHCKCNYCGCLNIILLNGKTQIAIGDYYVDGKNLNPTRSEKITTNSQNWKYWVVLGAMGLLVVGVVGWYFHNKKTKDKKENNLMAA